MQVWVLRFPISSGMSQLCLAAVAVAVAIAYGERGLFQEKPDAVVGEGVGRTQKILISQKPHLLRARCQKTFHDGPSHDEGWRLTHIVWQRQSAPVCIAANECRSTRRAGLVPSVVLREGTR